MKKISCLFLFFLILFSCKNQNSEVYILTNDVIFFELADIYNSRNKDNKVFINFYNEKQKNIFSFYKDNKKDYYDIVAGYNGYNNEFETKYFYNLKDYYENLTTTDYFNGFNDYIVKNDYYTIPYDIDFPVIIAKKELLSQTIKETISIQNFSNLCKNINITRKEENNYIKKIRFSPYSSNMGEIEYFFIFNDKIQVNNNIYFFNNEEMSNYFNFLYKFDDNYNFGLEETKKYFDKYKNIDKKLYLEKDIISFDFIQFSNSLTYQKEKFKILFIENLKHLTLKNKIIAITKNSKYKKQCEDFIRFLVSEEIQKILFEETYSKNYYFENINLPVIKNIISKSQKLDIDVDFLEKYIDNLSYIDFYNERLRSKFFETYNNSKESLHKGVLSEKDLLNVLINGIND